PQSAAYIITTSGSTGVPKLACVPHAALYNYVMGCVQLGILRPDDVYLQCCACTFDPHVYEA
ncbi:AMP-binding protein, partial [Acinetobacter baumannii]